MHVWIYIIYIHNLFLSLRAHQYSSDQKKILKEQSTQTTDSVMSAAYRLWLPFLNQTQRPHLSLSQHIRQAEY